MEKYTSIKESISEMSGGDIKPYYKKRIIPIIFILLGFPLLIWGIVKWNMIGYEETSYALVFGGFFLIGWGIVKLSYDAEYYMSSSSGEIVKPHTYYLNPDSQTEIEALLNNDKLKDVISHSIKKRTPLMLELWNVNSKKLVYAQLIHKEKSKKNPISSVHVSKME
ncbi:MAG: hypothetical protein Q4F97_09300 [Bacteroidales bacterium]|nr:hypothetical protein [Bacteroidales bacterium]